MCNFFKPQRTQRSHRGPRSLRQTFRLFLRRLCLKVAHRVKLGLELELKLELELEVRVLCT